jgi:hypothetical protein
VSLPPCPSIILSWLWPLEVPEGNLLPQVPGQVVTAEPSTLSFPGPSCLSSLTWASCPVPWALLSAPASSDVPSLAHPLLEQEPGLSPFLVDSTTGLKYQRGSEP